MGERAPWHDPGYTPARRDLDLVLDALVRSDDEREVSTLQRLLARTEGTTERAIASLPTAEGEGRVRITALLARMAPTDLAARATLLEALADRNPRVQRAAVRGLGKSNDPAVVEPLLRAADVLTGEPERRALIEALGKLGGASALVYLAKLQPGDPNTQRVHERASLIASRSASRSVVPDLVTLDEPLATPRTVVVTCREGLESALVEQLGVRSSGPLAEPSVSSTITAGRLQIRDYTGALGPLLARCTIRISIEVPLDLEHGLERAVVEILSEADLRNWLIRSSLKEPRVRLGLVQGRRRAQIWALTRAVMDARLGIVIDPTGAGFEIEIDEIGHRARVSPRRFRDPRFEYRIREVPAASHPTIAAALAHVAGVRANDIVWDPFVGSGLELCERALLGPYAGLVGSDLDPVAIAAAEANLHAAGAQARLHLADSLTFDPGPVSLILTNPPLGSRLHPDGGLERLLLGLLDRAATILGPGGRLVWLSPMPDRTARRAMELGFRVIRHARVDVGGLRPELQLMIR